MDMGRGSDQWDPWHLGGGIHKRPINTENKCCLLIDGQIDEQTNGQKVTTYLMKCEFNRCNYEKPCNYLY